MTRVPPLSCPQCGSTSVVKVKRGISCDGCGRLTQPSGSSFKPNLPIQFGFVGDPNAVEFREPLLNKSVDEVLTGEHKDRRLKRAGSRKMIF